MTSDPKHKSTFNSVGKRTSLSSGSLEPSELAHKSAMSTQDVPAWDVTRGYTQVTHITAADSGSTQPPAKRQRITTLESIKDSNLASMQPATPPKLPLLSGSDIGVKSEIIVIKDEEHIDATLVADESHQAATRQQGNINEAPQKEPLTLSTIEALELAEKCVDQYAGLHTKQLEEKLKEFSGMFLPWHTPYPCTFQEPDLSTAGNTVSDSNCLRCLSRNARAVCATCPRVFHTTCLPDDYVTTLQAAEAKRRDTCGINKEYQTIRITCPLCFKRFHGWIKPKQDLTPAARDKRILKIAHSLKRLPERLAWLELHDDGSLLSDRRLLEKIGTSYKPVNARDRICCKIQNSTSHKG
jgi:hypothetical protein